MEIDHRFQSLDTISHSILDQLIKNNLPDTPTNTTLVWELLSSIALTADLDPSIVKFWISLLPRARSLLTVPSLKLSIELITSIIQVCHCAVLISGFAVAHNNSNLNAISVLLGADFDAAETFLEFPVSPFFTPEAAFMAFEESRPIHNFSIPSVDDLIRRSLLVTCLRYSWNIPEVMAANSDYSEPENLNDQGCFSFIFVRFFYEEIFHVTIPRTFPSTKVTEPSLLHLVTTSLSTLPSDLPDGLCVACLMSLPYRPGRLSEENLRERLPVAPVEAQPESTLLDQTAFLDVARVTDEELPNCLAWWLSGVNTFITQSYELDATVIHALFALCEAAVAFRAVWKPKHRFTPYWGFKIHTNR
jgi:hypothetical protein